MLLPRQAGQAYVPSALRHLMDPGSPIADFYHVCPQCMDLGDRIADAMAKVGCPCLRLCTTIAAMSRVAACWLGVSVGIGCRTCPSACWLTRCSRLGCAEVESAPWYLPCSARRGWQTAAHGHIIQRPWHEHMRLRACTASGKHIRVPWLCSLQLAVLRSRPQLPQPVLRSAAGLARCMTRNETIQRASQPRLCIFSERRDPGLRRFVAGRPLAMQAGNACEASLPHKPSRIPPEP